MSGKTIFREHERSNTLGKYMQPSLNQKERFIGVLQIVLNRTEQGLSIVENKASYLTTV